MFRVWPLLHVTLQVITKLKTFFGRLGVHHILDSSCAGDFTMYEVHASLVDRMLSDVLVLKTLSQNP